jgi:HAD superfamily hydrolase (TIGR01509 family)
MSAPRISWPRIDTVLLDMDGTLLDLRFDNYFWLDLIPREYAKARRLALTEAQDHLTPRFAAHRGTLNWYCTDFWSRELGLDVARLKHDAREHIGWLPGAESFLQSLRAMGKRLVLVTNAHWDSLRIKCEHIGFERYFHALISSHGYGVPKEHAEFWPALQAEHPFDAERTLFVDDSLPVLRAARQYGVKHVVAISHPDSSQPPRICDEFPSTPRVAELLA